MNNITKLNKNQVEEKLQNWISSEDLANEYNKNYINEDTFTIYMAVYGEGEFIEDFYSSAVEEGSADEFLEYLDENIGSLYQQIVNGEIDSDIDQYNMSFAFAEIVKKEDNIKMLNWDQRQALKKLK
jgi:hypothetical protein